MKKSLIKFIINYIYLLVILEIYTLFSIGYFKKYSLFENSIIEFLTILILYIILYLFSKPKERFFIPLFFVGIYFVIDIVSESYNRYLDYSDLVNIPLLFDALLQSKGDIIYMLFIIPIILFLLIIKLRIIRVYFLAILIIILLFIFPIKTESILSTPYITIYNNFAYSHKNFWSPNKLVFDFSKIGRLSTFFYEGMIKKQRQNDIRLYIGDRKQELLKKIVPLKKHIKYRNIYLIGLESFFIPEELINLNLKYLNDDQNISYEVIKNSSTMITSIFGGGTIQSEFEALCGVPALQKISAFEFTEFTGSPTNCLPHILNHLGYKTIISNTYKPQPSFEALKSIGFQDINFPQEYFPMLHSYISNSDKIDGEYAIFDTDLYQQNQSYIKDRYLNNHKYIFNYMFSVWGHAFHEIYDTNHIEAISVENKSLFSISEHTIRAINQSYYRIKALQKYFNKIKNSDPNALVIAFSDHRPVLDGADSHYKFGLKKSVFHNFIVIMDRGKYIKFKKPFPLYALPDIILNQLTDGWYCKNNSCKIESNPNYREQYLNEYYAIMANAMKKSYKIDEFYISPRTTYFFNNPNIPFEGFSHAEKNFRWSNGKNAKIYFNIKDINILTGKINLNIGTLGEQKITILLNKKLLIDKKFNGSNLNLTLRFNTKYLSKNKINILEFKLPNAHRPNNGDRRVLGIAFKSMIIE
jgi:hypothetical protein